MLKASERSEYDKRFAVLWAIDPHSVIASNKRHAHSIEQVGKGGVLRLDGEVFVVQETATYTETDEKYKKDKKYVVTELVLYSLKTGATRYIEWAVDDELEISLTERKLGKGELGRRLQYDDGEVVDLNDMDEIVDEEWELVFDGTTYDYDDDWPARYESSDGRTFLVYFYEFGDTNTGWLTVEAWSESGKESDGWEHEVFLSEDVDPGRIEVISTGSASAT